MIERGVPASEGSIELKQRQMNQSERENSVAERKRAHIFYTGRVQGVGFRYTVKKLSPGFEITGKIRNLSDGRVELLAEGSVEELEDFLQAIRDSGLRRMIKEEDQHWSGATGEFRGFEITG